MRIKNIRVDNFKSLVDFRIDLANFNCIIGLNGSGKSTFLQFVDFLVHLMKGDIDEWLKRREWKTPDLYYHHDRKKSIDFCIEIISDAGEICSWEAKYSLKNVCHCEMIRIGDMVFSTEFKKNGIARYYVSRDGSDKVIHEAKINFKYKGSIFSLLDDVEVPSEFYAFRDSILSTESFELLSPHFLRQRTRESKGSIGLEGKELASFLFEIGKETRDKIVEQLAEVYPHIKSLDIKKLRAGWKQLDVCEKFGGEEVLKTESRHINDGMLRLVAISSQVFSNRNVLLFDEIENGIDPESIEFLLKQLIGNNKQTVVTTHSPMILNFIDDDIARKGVHYFYKTPEGHTRSIPFFSIPRINKKLDVMGPGEAFVDTDLIELVGEILAMPASPDEEVRVCT